MADRWLCHFLPNYSNPTTQLLHLTYTDTFLKGAADVSCRSLRSCACRYYYPFPPVGPFLYHMELSIGGQQFHGKGRTRQLAKHDAAARALKVLENEPMLQQLPVVRPPPRSTLLTHLIASV